mmetsp:Transcript_67764/g.220602  ORF Transcript_67764/g.220602 Transcript_67764/m.220602 type:complete len:165 (-) Transcript_67764:77-571(-)
MPSHACSFGFCSCCCIQFRCEATGQSLGASGCLPQYFNKPYCTSSIRISEPSCTCICSCPPQMSTRDSNDWTRMRKGGWWLRRGVRFDAMRYWYQFSDFSRFPGISYFQNLPELICMAQSMDVHAAAAAMRRHNEQTLVHSAAFWTSSLAELLAPPIQTSSKSG